MPYIAKLSTNETDALNRCLANVVEVKQQANKPIPHSFLRFHDGRPSTQIPVVDTSNIGICPAERLDCFRLRFHHDAGVLRHDDPITEIAFFIYHRFHHTAARLDVHFASGSRKLFGIPTLPDFMTLLNLGMTQGVLEHYGPQDHSALPIDWEKVPKAAVYQLEPQTEAIYQDYHRTLASALELLLPIPQPIVFYSAGCGDALELRCLQQLYQERYHSLQHMHFAGFDINAKNIKAATTNVTNGAFTCGNFVDFANLYDQQLSALFPSASAAEHSYQVVIFSGVLTRQVVQHSMKGLRIFQQATRRADCIALMGMGASVLSPWMFAAVGLHLHTELLINCYQSSTDQPTPSEPMRLLQPQQPATRVSGILERSMRRSRSGKLSTLDLALSANAARDLQLIAEHQPQSLADITSLDISWIYIDNTDEEKTLFTSIQELLPNLTQIIIHKNSPLVETAKTYARNHHCQLFARKDSAIEGELPAFTIPDARFYQLYDALPNQVLTTKQAWNARSVEVSTATSAAPPPTLASDSNASAPGR